jgi:alpha-amylase
VSPPNEHAILPSSPWWQRYQPVSYKLDSRSGTEQEFIRMIQRCNALGVRIYVDAVINHMSAIVGFGSAGTYFNSKTLEYPGVPFKYEDFNDSFSHTLSGNIESYYDVVQVRNCRLSGLPDLATGRYEVRQKIINYLNRLIDIGVAGFRIDASKHMWPEDIQAIVDGLNDLRVE